MKIRNGFVSNSSSSSFVIVTTKETFKNVLSAFTKEEQIFLQQIFNSPEKMKLDGKDYITFFGELNSEYVCEVWEETSPDDGDVDSMIVLDTFISKFSEKNNSFSRNV